MDLDGTGFPHPYSILKRAVDHGILDHHPGAEVYPNPGLHLAGEVAAFDPAIP